MGVGCYFGGSYHLPFHLPHSVDTLSPGILLAKLCIRCLCLHPSQMVWKDENLEPLSTHTTKSKKFF